MNTRDQLRLDALDLGCVDAACDLVLQGYSEQQRLLPYLPRAAEYRPELEQSMARIFRLGIGMMAFRSQQLVGFLAAYPVDSLFGVCRGVYSPLYGHSTVPQNRTQIYEHLYERTAELWVKSGHLSHALTMFTYDPAATEDWFWRGFGLRCVDAICPSVSLASKAHGLSVRKLTTAGVADIADLHEQHNLYYRQSPIFMPNESNDPYTELQQWMDELQHHLWAAYQGDRAVGYIRIEPDGESFISLHPSMMNITAAFVLPILRGAGVGTILLSTVAEWSHQAGYSLIGVDYEAINPAARRFWSRHFEPYTVSVTRRIDERIQKVDHSNG